MKERDVPYTEADLSLHPIDVGFNLKTQDMEVAVPHFARSADIEGPGGGHLLLIAATQEGLIADLRKAGYRAVPA